MVCCLCFTHDFNCFTLFIKTLSNNIHKKQRRKRYMPNLPLLSCCSNAMNAWNYIPLYVHTFGTNIKRKWRLKTSTPKKEYKGVMGVGYHSQSTPWQKNKGFSHHHNLEQTKATWAGNKIFTEWKYAANFMVHSLISFKNLLLVNFAMAYSSTRISVTMEEKCLYNYIHLVL